MNYDQQLWQGLLRGDKEMLVVLYKKYYHFLFFIGLKQINDGALVKDVIHELFLYLWEKRETIQPAKNIKNYLVTSFLRKLATDSKKSEKKGALHVVWNSLEENYPDPEETLIKKDDQIHLNKLLTIQINELSVREKELIVMKFYEGLAYEEIVRQTGLTHRTVYNKIYEGLKKLKSSLVKIRSSRTADLEC